MAGLFSKFSNIDSLAEVVATEVLPNDPYDTLVAFSFALGSEDGRASHCLLCTASGIHVMQDLGGGVLAEIEQQRKAAEWERDRPKREAAARAAQVEAQATAKAIAKFCPLLEQRMRKIKKSCEMAGNPSYCINARNQSTPYLSSLRIEYCKVL